MAARPAQHLPVDRDVVEKHESRRQGPQDLEIRKGARGRHEAAGRLGEGRRSGNRPRRGTRQGAGRVPAEAEGI